MARRPATRERLLFLSPSVASGAEREPQVSDFDTLDKKALGEGAFGEVFRVRHKETQIEYAIKVISKEKVRSANMLQQVRREVRIMYALTHPHIIKLYSHFEDDRNFYMILELAAGGTLWHRMARFGSFDEATAAQYLREVILAVEYLHSRDPPVIHRDIKPENLLLDKEGRDGRIKLADFGWSNFFNDTRSRKTYCGTLDYLAPEMILKQGHGTTLDIWNLGVLLYEMLTGDAPFKADTQSVMFNKILRVKIEFPKSFSPLAKDLVLRLLRANPEERLTIEEVQRHAWLVTHQPIRPTITQQCVKEALPCNLEGDTDEIASEDPIKPFNENEYRVISRGNEEVKTPVQEEAKKISAINLKAVPQTTPRSGPTTPRMLTPSSSRKQISRNESPTKDPAAPAEASPQARNDNATTKTQLETAEADIATVNRRIKELEGTLQTLEVDYAEKRQAEERLKVQSAERTSYLLKLLELQEEDARLYSELEDLKTQCFEKNTALNALKAKIDNLDLLIKEHSSQSSDVEREVSRLREEIEQCKDLYTKTKTDQQRRVTELQGEAQSLERMMVNKGTESGGPAESLLKLVKENLDLMALKTSKDLELFVQFNSSQDRLYAIELQLAELKTNEPHRDTPKPNINIEEIKGKLQDKLARGERSEELRKLQDQIARYERLLRHHSRSADNLDISTGENEELSRSRVKEFGRSESERRLKRA
jgi:serine/threonine protein kinase